MSLCVQNIIEALTNSQMPPEETVDKLEVGTPDMEVKGVAVTFLATQEVIEEAAKLGLNLIITHEGMFYSHRDKRSMLQSDSVYLAKCKIIENGGAAIYRLHDLIHKSVPDGITAGLLQALSWQQYEVKDLQYGSVLVIPSATLDTVISFVKERLQLQNIRFIGDLSMQCSRVGILVGYRGGGELAIPLFEKENLDLVICGEGPEWETPEYVRDAVCQGRKKAMIVLGHAESEAPGMAYLAKKLESKFPGIPVRFIPQKSVFQFF